MFHSKAFINLLFDSFQAHFINPQISGKVKRSLGILNVELISHIPLFVAYTEHFEGQSNPRGSIPIAVVAFYCLINHFTNSVACSNVLRLNFSL